MKVHIYLTKYGFVRRKSTSKLDLTPEHIQKRCDRAKFFITHCIKTFKSFIFDIIYQIVQQQTQLQ